MVLGPIAERHFKLISHPELWHLERHFVGICVYEWKNEKFQLIAIQFIKGIQNDVQDDDMLDAKWSHVSQI